jgi:uncharacterized heparinase superfamily protein
VISGKFTAAAAYFHLHPDVEARACSATEVLLRVSDGLTLRMLFTGAATIQLQSGTWHPRFGVVVASRCVVARFSGAMLTTRILWAKAQ